MESWEDLHLRDLFYAFRKAKADRFYETSIRTAEKFIDYEQDLAKNLQSLLVELQFGEIEKVISQSPASIVVLPKKAEIKTAAGQHAHFSSFDRERQNWTKNAVTPEFRLVADFSVEHHILSALWINKVGHKYDEVLGKSAIASRLRRYRSKGSKKLGEYHLHSIGSFEPYYGPYKDWRDGGLRALENSLRGGADVVAITLDVSNFYHSIDPTFAIEDSFLSESGISLTPIEKAFTASILGLLKNWNRECSKKMINYGCSLEGGEEVGLPIGISVSRLLSNVFLFALDKEFERELLPVYYSRYVDDIFIVLNDKSHIPNAKALTQLIADKVPSLAVADDQFSLMYDAPKWANASKISFGSEKQKAFFLSGAAGLDLLSNISEQIKAVSSERRLMPSVLDISKLSSARVLASGSSVSDDVDALRKADGLTLRRLGWSILLRTLSVLAQDLDASDWESVRKNVYRFAFDHVIRADKVLEYLDKIPWLFTIAISVRDYSAARDILFRTRESLGQIRRASGSALKINGCSGQFQGEGIWTETDASITKFFREALIRAYDFRHQDTGRKSLHGILSDLDLTADQLDEMAINALTSDWGRVPYRYAQETHVRRSLQEGDEILHNLYSRINELKEFISIRKSVVDFRFDGPNDNQTVEAESLLPYLFPTRPYLTEEIALLAPQKCVFEEQLTAARNWSRYVRAIRGIWTRPDELADLPIQESLRAEPDDNRSPPPSRVELGGDPSTRKVLLGISSFATSDKSWAIGASGRNDYSPNRYDAIQGIVNQAVEAKPRPEYLILPELALPARWIGTVSRVLAQSGISLIAGVDYSYGHPNQIYSSAVMSLRDERLGYPTTIQIRQEKCVPAPQEKQRLQDIHGKVWKDFDPVKKPIYNHFGFEFSVLVCSELSNIGHRKDAQGNVDAMFVLSWNQDLETFSALTESAALDVHCYIALCNNREFGDSRVRAPMKKSWERDVCRLRGGLNDHLAVVEIDIRGLRKHQSRATTWPQPDDDFKPVPEGFEISARRRTNPA